MNLDAFTIAALADELLDTIVGGRVQDVLDVDETSICLEIYGNHARHYLLLNASAQNPRIHLVPDKLRRGLPQPTTLGLLLRRYVEGARIGHIYQPPWERVLVIDIEGPEGPLSIIGELMDRRSNLLLVSDGRILDCMRRVGPHENRVRVSLPNHPYAPPPPQAGKVEPGQVDAEALAGYFADAGRKKAHQVLSGRVFGVSPLLGREIVFRAAGDSEQPAAQADPARVAHVMSDLLTPLLARQWQPGVCEQDGRVTAFSVYPVTALPGWRPVESVSAALSAFYNAPTGIEAYEAAKTPVRAALAEATGKVENKLNALKRSLKDTAELEALRQSGELLLAYQYTLTPGQNELRAAYEVEGPELRIAIDPDLTPLENAQRYFDRYNRAKRALEDVPALVAAAEAELATLAQLSTDCDLAANWPDIDDVQQALDKFGYWRGAAPARAGGGRSGPLRVVSDDGFVIWVGRNSRQNENVTFDKAGPSDWWLHARGVPGAHVVIKADGRTVPNAVFEQAAGLAAAYSAARGEARVVVDVTLRKHVRRIAGGAAGMVTYRNETTRTVAPGAAQQ
jgi:predicted ribosome quality control (RQC) complex YloA/Tae2 family protein